MSKHTPGPWECQLGHSDWGMPNSHIIVQEGETGNDFDTWIAEIHSVTPYCAGASRKDKDRASAQTANARLIAAAPDLLEALKNLVNLDQRCGWHSKEQAAAIVAIAKAEGRQ